METALSPLSLRPRDLGWVLPLGAGMGVLIWRDVALYQAFHDSSQSWAVPLASSLTWGGDGLVDMGIAVSGWAVGKGKLRDVSAAALQGEAVVGLYAWVLKLAFSSNRPSTDDTERRFFDYSLSTQGFPSGHSMSAFCLAEVYGSQYGRWWTYPLALGVAWSRIVLGQHWTSDVVAGSLVGIGIGHLAARDALRDGPPTVVFSVSRPAETDLITLSFKY